MVECFSSAGWTRAARAAGTVEAFDPDSGTFQVIATGLPKIIGFSATLLDDGEILIAGGRGDSTAMTSASWLAQALMISKHVISIAAAALCVTMVGCSGRDRVLLVPGGSGADHRPDAPRRRRRPTARPHWCSRRSTSCSPDRTSRPTT